MTLSVSGHYERGPLEEMPANETISRSRLPFLPGNTAIFRTESQAVKTIVQPESRHWIHSNEWAPAFRLLAAFPLA